MYGSDAMAGVIIFHDEVLPAPGKRRRQRLDGISDKQRALRLLGQRQRKQQRSGMERQMVGQDGTRL